MKDWIKEHIKKQNEVLSKPMKSKKDFENFNKVMSNVYMKPQYRKNSEGKLLNAEN